MFQCLTFKDI